MARPRKGQLIFEFVVAAVVFITIVVYVLGMLNSSVSASSMKLYMNEEESRAVYISELLMKFHFIDSDRGYPFISIEKAGQFLTLICPGNDQLLNDFDLGNRKFYARLTYSNPPIKKECGNSPPKESTHVSRVGLITDINDNHIVKPAKLDVYVW